MKFTKYILFLLLIAFIGSAIYIAVQPNTITVSKTKTIEAPQEIIYKYVHDLNTWKAWAPWKKKSSSDSILNSDEYTWIDDNTIGKITTASGTKFSKLEQTLIFPEYPKSQLDWTIDSISKQTSEVTFRMTTNNIPFKKKAYYAFFGSPEKDLAPKFETSLNQLDTLITNSMKVYSVTVNGVTNYSGGYYLYKTTSCKIDHFQEQLQAIKPEITNYVADHHIAMSGFPFVMYHKWDRENNATIFSYCIPTNTQVNTTSGDILTGYLPAFKTLKTTLKGNYNYLDDAWDATIKHLETNSLQKSDEDIMLETFVTNPEYVINPADWITEIYVSVKEKTDSIPLDLSKIKLPAEDIN